MGQVSFPDPSLGTERKDRQRQLFNWMGAVNSLTAPDLVPKPNQSARPRLRASQYESHHSGDWMQADSAAPGTCAYPNAAFEESGSIGYPCKLKVSESVVHRVW